MIRTVFALLLFCITLVPVSVFAAVDVRAGNNTDYSRLVFDWGSRVPYTLKQESAGKLLLSFEKEGEPNAANASADNLIAFDVISTKPLQIRLTIPEKSATRDFYIGSRVVIDIYNPPGGAQKVAKTKISAPKPEQKTEKPAEEKIAQPDVLSDKVEKKAAVKPADVETEELTEKPEDTALHSAVMAASDIDPHIVTITSTKNVGLAVFENYDRTWLITDLDEKFLTPQINGPDPDIFPPLEEVKVRDGRAFGIKMPDGAFSYGQGEGLLWKLVVSPHSKERTPVEFTRKIDAKKEPRGGRVVWAFKDARHVVDFPDPVTGRMIKVVTVDSADSYAGAARHFVEFDVLESVIGMAIRPRVDDLEVNLTKEGVEITRPGGLALTPEASIRTAKEGVEDDFEPDSKPVLEIYSFSDWQMGGIDALNQNRNIYFADLMAEDGTKKSGDLISLAKMYLSNARAAEALGFLEYAQDIVPELESNPEFLALRGAARAVDWKSEDAFRDLSIKELEPYTDVQYWRAYALADLGDWRQAYEVLPEAVAPVGSIPDTLQDRLALVLAEIALRNADVDRAQKLLKMVKESEDNLQPPFKAALVYLEGEAQRQLGNLDKAEEQWDSLVEAEDDLYRVKAGLAITRLRYEQDKISVDKAIDSLERLRYAWRGDQLEASVNYWLGRAYFDADEYIKGLNIMRDAATYAVGTALGERIAQEMTESFTTIFLSDQLDDLSALDAVAIYEQFSELAPADERGEKVVEMLAEHLVKADLLNRSAGLLEHQIRTRLKGKEAARVAVRTAAIRLLNKQPDEALKNLETAEDVYETLASSEDVSEKMDVIDLLRARAYSQSGRADAALDLLNEKALTPDINRLRADIAWRAGYWDDAAEALKDIIIDQEISLTRPLREDQAALLLNRAVALNLASDRIALSNMREKYSDAMAQTEQARMFEVVTRPRQSPSLADRDTLFAIVSEVDLFKDFLNGYKGTDAPSN